jgi:hypothetical protein
VMSNGTLREVQRLHEKAGCRAQEMNHAEGRRNEAGRLQVVEGGKVVR